MSQHKPFEPESRDPLERNSDPPEPTQSERRLRSSVNPGASERPGRPSVRPSAFGAPRPSTRPSARPSAAPKPAAPSKPPTIAGRRFEEDEDDRDADTAPGLIFTAATATTPAKLSEAPSRFSSQPPGPIPVPTTARSSAPMPMPMPSSAPPLQLVLAKTSLPDAPAHMVMPAQAAPAAPADPRRASGSVLVFAVMLCAAAVPIGRYAMRRPPEPAPETVPARALMERPSTKPAVAKADMPAPAPAKVDRLGEIMAGLPAEASQASQYLVDHAIRARDSGELALAETLLGRASALDDRNPHPAFALAQLRFEQGNYEGAEGWIANAVRLRPRRAEYRRLYAEILLRLGREHEAHEEQRKAKRLHD